MQEQKLKKLYYRVSELKNSAIKKIKNGEIFVKGASMGFKSGDEYLSYRLGFSTGIYSYYGQGKTMFLVQELVHLSNTYNWKHMLWLTENGKKDELISDIIQTKIGINLSNPYREITDEELLNAYEWADQHFFVIDHEVKMMNIRDIYEITSTAEKELNIKIQTVSIDNVTNLAREQSKNNLMIHEYMNYLMSAINRTSSLKQYHTFTLFHVNKPESFIEFEGKRYLRPPSVFSIVGGQMTNYLGYNLIGVYRPVKRSEDIGLINPLTNQPYMPNEVEIIVEKSKPQGVGKEGNFSLYFDTDRRQYFEYSDNFTRKYAGEWDLKVSNPSKVISPNKEFETEQRKSIF